MTSGATTEDMKRLTRSDNAMVQWICSRKLTETLSTEQLRARLGLHNIQDVVRASRLRWYGHLQRMDNEKWPRKITTLEVKGQNHRGRPRKRWIDNIRKDFHHLNLYIDPQDRGK